MYSLHQGLQALRSSDFSMGSIAGVGKKIIGELGACLGSVGMGACGLQGSFLYTSLVKSIEMGPEVSSFLYCSLIISPEMEPEASKAVSFIILS